MGLAANKFDLFGNQQVSEKEGEEFANKIDAIFSCTSAKESIGITPLFEKIDYDKLSSTEKMEYRRIRELRETIASSQPEVDKKRAKLKKNGPVSDVEGDLIKNNKVLNKK